MARSYELQWIDPEREVGPVFQIGRDVYERERPGQRFIRLRAVESYPPSAVDAAVQAFHTCAKAWGAPVVFVIDPNLMKPPAGRFLFEWSRQAHQNRSVEQCAMVTHNRVSQLMGRLVLRLFTDGEMPFQAVQGEPALQAMLDGLDLSCPRDGFSVVERNTSLVLHGEQPGLMGSLWGRLVRRVRGGSNAAPP